MDLLAGLNAPQRAAVTHECGPLLIFAGAGSGKTRTLTHRIAYLVHERGVPPSRIIAVTFTNKAAREMQERLDSLIGPSARRLWMGTFHAMCARMLRIHGDQIGLDPRFVIFDSDDSTRIIKETLRDLDVDTERYPPARVLGRISDAKNNMRSPEDVASVASSPADRVMARLYAAYQQRLANARALDFDDLLLYAVRLLRDAPAGDTLAERFEHVLIDEFQDANLAQFLWAQQLARVHRNIAVVGDDDQCLPPGTLVETPQGKRPIEAMQVGEEIFGGAGRGTTAVSTVQRVLSRHYEGPLVCLQTRGGHTLRLTPNHMCFARHSFATQTFEQDVDLVIFGGEKPFAVTHFAHTILSSHQESIGGGRPGAHAEQMSHSVLLAENLAQKQNGVVRRWAALTTGDKFAFQPASHLRPSMVVPVWSNGCLIEDEIVAVETAFYSGPVYDLNVENLHNFVAQGIAVHNSIYSWRGADVRLILDFEQVYSDATVIRLEQNYRSTQNILDAAHGVISKNVGRAPKRLWSDEAGGARLSVQGLANAQEEAYWVARKIQDMQRQEHASLSEFAILCRVNAQSRPFEEAFLRLRLPLRLVGTQRFYERREIKDLVAYLRIIFNPNDGLALLRIINVPPRGIGATTIDKLQHLALAEGRTLHEVLNDEAALNTLGRAASVKLGAVRDLLNALREDYKNAGTMAELISSILLRTGFEDYLRREKGSDTVDRVANVDEFLSAAVAFDDRMSNEPRDAEDEVPTDGAPFLGLFLESTALESDSGATQKESDAVTLMTLHAAKGLEFPNVFLVGAEQGLLPHSRALWGASPGELEEERRLCYVGLTRARQRVFMTYAAQRTLHGRTETTQPSQFLEEIPGHLLDRGGFAATRSFSPAQASTFWQPVPKAPSGPVEPSKFQIGDRVKHPSFGEGVVVDASPPGEKNEWVHVAFLRSDIGKKKLIVAFAPVEKV